ncbi:MAG: hypothetical protein ACE5H1_09245 [Thermodesulfobacteriota bacterium]
MNKRANNKKGIRAILEFEKRYFPRSFKKKMTEEPEDAHALGITWAQESLNKIRKQLRK